MVHLWLYTLHRVQKCSRGCQRGRGNNTCVKAQQVQAMTATSGKEGEGQRDSSGITEWRLSERKEKEKRGDKKGKGRVGEERRDWAGRRGSVRTFQWAFQGFNKLWSYSQFQRWATVGSGYWHVKGSHRHLCFDLRVRRLSLAALSLFWIMKLNKSSCDMPENDSIIMWSVKKFHLLESRHCPLARRHLLREIARAKCVSSSFVCTFTEGGTELDARLQRQEGARKHPTTRDGKQEIKSLQWAGADAEIGNVSRAIRTQGKHPWQTGEWMAGRSCPAGARETWDVSRSPPAKQMEMTGSHCLCEREQKVIQWGKHFRRPQEPWTDDWLLALSHSQAHEGLYGEKWQVHFSERLLWWRWEDRGPGNPACRCVRTPLHALGTRCKCYGSNMSPKVHVLEM